MKVLIIDDEEDICRRLQRELKKEGFEVEYTTSPVGVIERLHNAKRDEKPYEMLLLDLRMPEGNGFELLKEIREARLDMDVVIITGYGDEDKAVEAIRLGAVDYLRKPISLEELHTAIFRIQQKRAVEAKQVLRHSILVVDDEKDLCTRIRRELEREGYETAVAYDGVEGLDYFKNHKVDVVIADIRMPKMNGLEMLKACREITGDFISIIITGHGDHETAIEALKLGVSNYLRKPISLEELVVSVSKGTDLLLLRRGLSARRRELKIETALKEQYAKNLEKMVEERTKEIRKLSDAVHASTDSIVISDPDGKITDVNEATLKMYGTDDKTELVGKSSFDLIAPEDREKAAAGMKEAMEKGYVRNREYQIVIKDGSKIPVEMNASVMKGVDGEPIGFVGISRDITERKKAEEEVKKSRKFLDTIIENIPDSLYIKNKQFRFVEVNKAFCHRHKVTKGEILGEPRYRETDERIFKTGKGLEILEQHFTDAEGNQLWTHLKKVPLTDESGNVTHVLTISRDITERKKAEKQIEASLEEKEVLLREIHHRVKNNLQVISSLLNLQSRYIKDKEALELFRESQGRVKSIARIHEKLYQSKDLARVDFGGYIRSLTSDLLYSYAADPNFIKLKTNVEEVSLGIDTAIPSGLIVNELVTNSIKHAFPDGMEGEISIDLRSDDGKFTLIVKDDGVGFPEDLDFRKTETLGLQLVVGLVDQLDGKIDLDRTHGVAFKITFKELKYKGRI